MTKLAAVLAVFLIIAPAAAGRIAVWLEVPGPSDYRLVEAARAGFEEGLVQAGHSLVPREEATSLNTVIDPADDGQLAMFAAALGCDYAAALTVRTTRGGGVELNATSYDPFTGRRSESPAALAETADGAGEMARRLAAGLAEKLPAAGPLLSLDARWNTAQAALGSKDGLAFNDYLWVWRYGDPLVHPDTGALLGVEVVVVGAGRVEELRGEGLSLVSLSPPAEGLAYAADDRVRALDEETYRRLGFARGTVVPFGTLGFGSAAISPVPLPGTALETARPEGVELELAESLTLDYSPVGLDAVNDVVALSGDDGRLHLYSPQLKGGAERVVEADCSGPVALLGDELYLGDSWGGVVLRMGLEAQSPETFVEEISPELLISGSDGRLWAVVFSHSTGRGLATYPALRLGAAGDVVEVRRPDAGKLKSIAVAPDGTLYYLTSFKPVQGLRPDGTGFEVGARMLPDPKALDTDRLGWLYVADARNGLTIFDERQRVMGSWGGAGVVNFRNIDLVAVAGENLYLASGWDRVLHRVSLEYLYPER